MKLYIESMPEGRIKIGGKVYSFWYHHYLGVSNVTLSDGSEPKKIPAKFWKGFAKWYEKNTYKKGIRQGKVRPYYTKTVTL